MPRRRSRIRTTRRRGRSRSVRNSCSAAATASSRRPTSSAEVSDRPATSATARLAVASSPAAASRRRATSASCDESAAIRRLSLARSAFRTSDTASARSGPALANARIESTSRSLFIDRILFLQKKKGGRSLLLESESRPLVSGSPTLRRPCERPVDQPFDLVLVHAVDDRNLGHDQVLGTLVHLLLAERQRLARHDEVQGLQYVRDVMEPAALHLVEVLLVTALPVARRRETSVAQGLHEPGNVLALSEPPQADEIGVADRNHDLGVVRQKPQVVEAAGGNRGRVRYEALTDLFHNGNAVIRVDDFLSDSKSHRNLLKTNKIELEGADYRENPRKTQVPGAFGPGRRGGETARTACHTKRRLSKPRGRMPPR